jgi:hypothetical protein
VLLSYRLPRGRRRRWRLRRAPRLPSLPLAAPQPSRVPRPRCHRAPSRPSSSPRPLTSRVSA